MISERELHVAAKLLKNFKHLKGVSTFLFSYIKRQLTCEVLKEIRVAIAIVVGLVNVNLNLQITILRFRT